MTYTLRWTHLSRVILLCFSLQLCGFTQIYAQTVKDSLDNLLATSKKDSERLSIITSVLKNAGLSAEEEVQEYYKKGLSITDTPREISILQKYKCIQLIQLGSTTLLEESVQEFKEYAAKNELHNQFIMARIFEFDNLERNKKVDEALDSFTMLQGTIDQEKHNFKYAEVLYKRGSLHYKKGDTDLALSLIDSCIAQGDQQNESSYLVGAHLLRGRIARRLGDYDEARDEYNTAAEIAKKGNHISGHARALNNLGNIYHLRGELDKAMDKYLASLKIKEKVNDQRGIAMAYANLGTIMSDLDDFDEAEVFFNKSISQAKEINYHRISMMCLNRLGTIATQKEEFLKAESYHLQALDIAKEHKNATEQMSAMYYLGMNYTHLGDHIKSYEYLLETLDKVRAIKNKPYEGAVLAGIAKNYATEKSGSTNKNGYLEKELYWNDTRIKSMLDKALKLANELDSPESKQDVLEALIMYSHQKKDYQAEASFLTEMVSIRDTLLSHERTEAVAEWETKFNLAEKEKEIVMLEAEQEVSDVRSQRNMSLFIASVLFFLGLISFGLVYMRQRAKRIEAKKSEAFRSKLSTDLHDDVGSILTGLAMQTELLQMSADPSVQDRFDKINQMSRDAMGRMRDTVWAIDSSKDTIDDLEDRIKDFAEDSINPSGKFVQFNIDIKERDKKLKPEVRQAFYLVFKEAATNALKYSTGDKIEAHLSLQQEEMILMVKDQSNVTQNEIKTSGLGLNSMKNRMKKIGGTFTYKIDNGFQIEATAALS